MPERATYRYDAFGLNIASEFALEELRAGDASRPPDLVILDRDIGRELPDETEGVVMDYCDHEGVVMAWPGVAAFRIVDRNTIWAHRSPQAPDRFLAFPLLGPVMAWLLNMRDMFVLHASAVHREGRTVAFMGDKLAGKSTTAAAFLRAGYALVTDDLLAIEFKGTGAPKCFPAFPQLKLEDKTAQAVKVAGSSPRPLVTEGFPKRQHALAGMITHEVPIDCLVCLERKGEKPRFIASDTAAGAALLNRYSYLPRFSKAPWSKQDHARHFTNCITLAQRSLVGTLQVPADLGALDEVVDYMTQALAGIDRP